MTKRKLKLETLHKITSQTDESDARRQSKISGERIMVQKKVHVTDMVVNAEDPCKDEDQRILVSVGV